jgi:hypothetical protein
MKKIIVCCLLLCCCTLLKAQTKQDSLPQKFKQPMFMPNVGYSFLTGRIVKVGSWVKISNRFYGELAYAYYHENISNNSDFFAESSAHKLLFGCNYFLDKAEMKTFLNISYLRRYYHLYAYDLKQKRIEEEENKISYSYSLNLGYKTVFLKSRIGTILKIGIAVPGIPVLFGTTPLNMECSFYYSF